ncbi:hypothetical protein [Pseudemcibacter aquimaris]|uniref:hypothetical protein n=1 Tax=Pseudemcibacter aquimaris TaxID=2857064 RepID=UPI00201120E4|nr:hypothetical protein [Pseudemcibacter aquimaris]MCC3860029.1 hypothetical protein [Pseudemcibacter aquimaris]WDU57359.1 hypothetical protein KW060_09125 [Pseudemcibacter aquimaris]
MNNILKAMIIIIPLSYYVILVVSSIGADQSSILYQIDENFGKITACFYVFWTTSVIFSFEDIKIPKIRLTLLFITSVHILIVAGYYYDYTGIGTMLPMEHITPADELFVISTHLFSGPLYFWLIARTIIEKEIGKGDFQKESLLFLQLVFLFVTWPIVCMRVMKGLGYRKHINLDFFQQNWKVLEKNGEELIAIKSGFNLWALFFQGFWALT